MNKISCFAKFSHFGATGNILGCRTCLVFVLASYITNTPKINGYFFGKNRLDQVNVYGQKCRNKMNKLFIKPWYVPPYFTSIKHENKPFFVHLAIFLPHVAADDIECDITMAYRFDDRAVSLVYGNVR